MRKLGNYRSDYLNRLDWRMFHGYTWPPREAVLIAVSRETIEALRAIRRPLRFNLGVD